MSIPLLLYIQKPLKAEEVELIKIFLSLHSATLTAFITAPNKQTFEDVSQCFSRDLIYNFNEYVPIENFLACRENFSDLLMFNNEKQTLVPLEAYLKEVTI